MRLNISEISVSSTIEAETKNRNFRHEYPDSTSGGSIFDKISKVQKYFSRIEIKETFHFRWLNIVLARYEFGDSSMFIMFYL